MCAQQHPNGDSSFIAPPSCTFLVSDEQAREILVPLIAKLNAGARGATTGFIEMRNSKGDFIRTNLRVTLITIDAIAALVQEVHIQHARNLLAQESLTATVPNTVTNTEVTNTTVTTPKRKAGREPDRETEREHEREPETEQQMRKRMQLESAEYARSRGVCVQQPLSYQKLTPVSVVAGSRRKRTTKKKKRVRHAHCCIGGKCQGHAMQHAHATRTSEGDSHGRKSTTAQPEGESANARPEGDVDGRKSTTAQPEGESANARPEGDVDGRKSTTAQPEGESANARPEGDVDGRKSTTAQPEGESANARPVSMEGRAPLLNLRGRAPLLSLRKKTKIILNTKKHWVRTIGWHF
jgi:hypothetical protein